MHSSQATVAAERSLELVGMRDAMHRPISSYSRGMRQRTKLAQAVAHDPELLILDEPFNGLDPVARHEMTLTLRDWIDQGKSVLLASHILHEVESVTQSFLLIFGGRLMASGTAEEVHEMLVDLPNEVTLTCNHPHRLAGLVVEQKMSESLRIDGHSITVETRHPSQLMSRLPEWIAETDIEITEMHAADESLKALFNSLMKIHRGER